MRGTSAGIPGYRVKHRVTPHSDAGSSKVPLVGIAFADIPWIPHQVWNDREGISGYRVVARYDVEHRIKREMT